MTEIFAEEINKDGGVMLARCNKKVPLKFVIYDDQSVPATAVSLYERMATVDEVDLFVGPDWTSMAVNVRGVFESVKAAVPHMRRQKYGKIVNIASGTVFKGSPMLLHYVTSKGAVLAMTRAMARELGDDGIRVNCLAPGLIMGRPPVGGAREQHHRWGGAILALL